MDDDIEHYHPYLVKDLRLCVIAKDLKECSVFRKSKLFRVAKTKLIDALKAVGVDVPSKVTKEEIGDIIIEFVTKECDCLTFVE